MVLLPLSVLLLLAAFVCCVLALTRPANWPAALSVAVLLVILDRLLMLLPWR